MAGNADEIETMYKKIKFLIFSTRRCKSLKILDNIKTEVENFK